MLLLWYIHWGNYWSILVLDQSYCILQPGEYKVLKTHYVDSYKGPHNGTVYLQADMITAMSTYTKEFSLETNSVTSQRECNINDFQSSWCLEKKYITMQTCIVQSYLIFQTSELNTRRHTGAQQLCVKDLFNNPRGGSKPQGRTQRVTRPKL